MVYFIQNFRTARRVIGVRNDITTVVRLTLIVCLTLFIFSKNHSVYEQFLLSI